MEYNKKEGNITRDGKVVWQAKTPVKKATRRVRQSGNSPEFISVCYIMEMENEIDFIFEKTGEIVTKVEFSDGWFAPH